MPPFRPQYTGRGDPATAVASSTGYSRPRGDDTWGDRDADADSNTSGADITGFPDAGPEDMRGDTAGEAAGMAGLRPRVPAGAQRGEVGGSQAREDGAGRDRAKTLGGARSGVQMLTPSLRPHVHASLTPIRK